MVATTEGATMARPDYRKRKGGQYYAWHFCASCKNWPASDYDSRSTPGDPLCDKCQELERKGECT